MEASYITLVVSCVTVLVSVATWFIARSQMKIASAKIKLDLYNKRFNIYLSTLEYYQSAFAKTHEDMKAKAIPFIKSYREAQFLFDPKDGVYETLGRIQQSATAITVMKEANADENWPLRHDQQSMYLLHQRSVQGYGDFAKDLTLLEQQLEKYIQFRAVSGWRFSEMRWVKSIFARKSCTSDKV